jgi:hypothetical protein
MTHFCLRASLILAILYPFANTLLNTPSGLFSARTLSTPNNVNSRHPIQPILFRALFKPFVSCADSAFLRPNRAQSHTCVALALIFTSSLAVFNSSTSCNFLNPRHSSARKSLSITVNPLI